MSGHKKNAPADQKAAPRTTINAEEIARFSKLGADWWDENGPMAPLHRINPVRIDYIDETAGPLKGRRLVDVGCGGGLAAEALARRGACVTAIDASAENIGIAQAHASASGLVIDYRATTAEALAETGSRFDIVTALEVIEHVDDVSLFVESCCKLVAPGGVMIVSTLNRTAKSFALGIVAAEYLLRWLPAGTHDWRKFLKPSEIAALLRPNDFTVTDACGLVFRPGEGFVLDREDLGVNYLLAARRTG